MIFAVFDPSPLTLCINCSFLHLFILNTASISGLFFNHSCPVPRPVFPIVLSFFSHKRTFLSYYWVGWVGLVGWPIADGLPTYVVIRQLQVERGTGKVRSKTGVLPLCYATNQFCGWRQSINISRSYNSSASPPLVTETEQITFAEKAGEFAGNAAVTSGTYDWQLSLLRVASREQRRA